MTTRIGLMGFGRIGRNVFRLLHERDDLDIVAIADIAQPEALTYLLKYDSIYGRFPADISYSDGKLQYADKPRGHALDGHARGRDPPADHNLHAAALGVGAHLIPRITRCLPVSLEQLATETITLRAGPEFNLPSPRRQPTCGRR